MPQSKQGKKKDDFSKIILVQTISCLLAVAVLLISVRFNDNLGKKFCEEYEKLMSGSFSSERFSDAFKSIKEYAAAFAGKEDEPEKTPEKGPEPASGANAAEESASPLIGGGVDLEFTSLDTLEGICFEEIQVAVDFAEPLDAYTLTSGFGYRISPVTGEPGIHTGLDMAADYGTPIHAAAAGTVVDASYDNSYGYYVKLQHDDDTVTIYAHCSRLCVEAGDTVKQGEKIAEVGSTGSSTGNHLHFEVRKENIRINPDYILFPS